MTNHEKTPDHRGTSMHLDLWDVRIAKLEEQLSQVEPDVRRRLGARLLMLARKHRALKRRLREAAHAGTETDWDDVRRPFEETVEDLRALAKEVRAKVQAA